MLTKFDQARLMGFKGTRIEFILDEYKKGGIEQARDAGFDGDEQELKDLLPVATPEIIKYLKGTPGLNAFDHAVIAGFTGTEKEWLDSLQGKNGLTAYEIALAHGFEGSEELWVKALDGANGMSAYEVWLMMGNTGDEQDFLDSLKGLKGDKGEDGKTPTQAEIIAIVKAILATMELKGEKGDIPNHQVENNRIRFEKPDGKWGEWLTIGNGSFAGGGSGGGSISIQKFYNDVASFPTVGKTQILYFDKSTSPYGVYVWDGTAYQQVGGGGSSSEVAPTGEAMGFENRTDSTLSASSTDFTISGAFNVWVKNVKKAKTAPESIALNEGINYISYNSAGALVNTSGYFDFANNAPVAIVYKNGDAVRLHEERHGITMDWATHQYLHNTRGAAYSSGFDAGDYILNGDGSLDAQAKIGLTGGVFYDEDIRISIANGALADFVQPLTPIAKLPVVYKIGTAWNFDAPTDFALKTGDNGRMVYNKSTAGVFSLTEVANNHYGVMFVVATNCPNNPIISIMSQASYSEATSADAYFYSDLDLTGFPTHEFRPLYKLVFRTANSYDNAVKSYLHSVTDIREVGQAGAGESVVPYEQSVRKSFETVAKNLDASNAVFNYSSGDLATIIYSNGVTKTMTYTSGDLTKITLSGSTPNGITLNKNLSYTDGDLTGVTYD